MLTETTSDHYVEMEVVSLELIQRHEGSHISHTCSIGTSLPRNASVEKVIVDAEHDCPDRREEHCCGSWTPRMLVNPNGLFSSDWWVSVHAETRSKVSKIALGI